MKIGKRKWLPLLECRCSVLAYMMKCQRHRYHSFISVDSIDSISDLLRTTMYLYILMVISTAIATAVRRGIYIHF